MTPIERKQAISQSDPLPVVKRCVLMKVSWSAAYHKPQSISSEQLSLMQKLDEIHLRYPFYGSHRLKTELYDEYQEVVNRKRVQRLMVLMGIQAIYPGKHRREL